MRKKYPSAAKAGTDFAAFTARLKPCPFKAASFSAACKAGRDFAAAFDYLRAS